MRRSVLFACLAALLLAVPAGAAKTAAVHRITQSASYLMIDPIYTSIMDGNKIVGC